MEPTAAPEASLLREPPRPPVRRPSFDETGRTTGRRPADDAPETVGRVQREALAGYPS